ncbi:hypothetical protein K2Q00_01880 [Patescibacteria group bacterium]|nr:hypothetical protein [Patescibacteria group bacterium]
MPAKTTPKDFFLWAGAMVSLFGSIAAFIGLVFDYINYAFPDPLAYYVSNPYENGVAYEMSSLIILGALCLVLMRVIHSTIKKDPTRADVWVRRWALFLTLFVAGAAIAIDLIVLLTSFLNGESLTTAFLLKVLVVLLVAAAGFMHFLADLRGYWNANPTLSIRVSVGVGILVILTILAGFFILGTPQQARQMRLDMQRVSDLQTLQGEITNYYQQKQALPSSLAELNDPLLYNTVPVDPETNQPYEYSKTASLGFELCATFKAASSGNTPSRTMPVKVGGVSQADNWVHTAGRSCFVRSIDPDFFPPPTKNTQ